MQNFQLYLFLLVFAFSAIQWAYKKLRENRAINQAEHARQRAKLEALRTGRPVTDQEEDEAEDEQAAVRTRLEELAERRRRQIEAMRRQQAQAGTQSSTPPTAGQAPGPAPPSPARPNQARPTPAQPGPRRAGSSRPQTAQGPVPTRNPQAPQRLPQQRTRQQPPPRRPQPSPPAPAATPTPEAAVAQAISPILNPAVRRQRQSPTQQISPISASSAGSIGKLDRAALRRGIVISELLSPPIALRNPSDGSA